MLFFLSFQAPHGVFFVYGGAVLERDFQAKLIKELKQLFPDALIFKIDSKQGLPDVMILSGNRWASLECKIGINAHHQPNQDYYVRKMNDMSFSAFVYPENKNSVIESLKEYFTN